MFRPGFRRNPKVRTPNLGALHLDKLGMNAFPPVARSYGCLRRGYLKHKDDLVGSIHGTGRDADDRARG